MFALDFGLVRDIMVEQSAHSRGHVTPTRGVGLGLRSLVWRDVQRLLRYPRPLLLLAASVVVPYAITALGLSVLSPSISALVLMVALIPFMNSLRVLTRTKGLARSFPFTTGQLRTASMIIPAILGLLWGVAVVPAFMGVGSGVAHQSFPDAVMSAMITAAAGILAAVRWVSAAPANYQAPMMATQMGAMPPGLGMNLIRGFDIVVVVTLPLVLGWPVWVAVAIAGICFAVLRAGLDRDALMADQEERRRQLDEARGKARGGSAGNKEKIRIQRGR